MIMNTNVKTGAASSFNKSTLQYAKLQMENSSKQEDSIQPEKQNKANAAIKDDKGTKIDFSA